MNQADLDKIVKENGQYDRIVAMKATWEKRRGKRKLYTISVMIPVIQDQLIDFMCNEGFYHNRSEFIRKAIEEAIDRQLGLIERQAELIYKFNVKVKSYDEN